MIDVATEWMSDLKEGWCPSAGYYNRESCCWINNDTNLNMIEEHCSLWHTYNKTSLSTSLFLPLCFSLLLLPSFVHSPSVL